jgi:glucokinase-like ROK family protein
MPVNKRIVKTIDAMEMRGINRSAILELIRGNGPISRPQIADELQVSLPTVKRIVDDLIEEKLVRPTGQKEWSGGRKRSLLEFNGAEHLVLGIDLGGTKIYGAVANLNGEILYETNFTHHQCQAEESFQMLCEVVENLLESALKPGYKINGIGIGVPGMLDPNSGIVKFAPSLEWDNFPLLKRLSERFDYPIVLENDVNLAALGELWFGARGEEQDLVLIAIGTGIGAGIVINGMVYSGAHHMAGEIGYLLPDRSHLGKSYPGFGAFEQLASGTGIAERARDHWQGERTQEQLDTLTSEDVFDAARRQEPWATQILDETVDYLAQAVAAITLIFDPDVIILGGGVSRSDDLLIEPILKRLDGTIPVLPRIAASHLGYRAAVYGSIVHLLRITANYYMLQRYS